MVFFYSTFQCKNHLKIIRFFKNYIFSHLIKIITSQFQIINNLVKVRGHFCNNYGIIYSIIFFFNVKKQNTKNVCFLLNALHFIENFHKSIINFRMLMNKLNTYVTHNEMIIVIKVKDINHIFAV